MVKQMFFDSIMDAAGHITEVLSNVLQLDTIFVANNDGTTNRILKAFNRNEVLVQEGLELPLKDTYCNLVSEKAVYVAHTLDHPSTCSMPVTADTGDHSFIGFPVMHQNGQIFGTICALHDPGYIFSKSDIQAMNSMAIFLTYVVELENRLHQQTELNEILVQDNQKVVEKVDDLQLQNQELDTKLQIKSDTMAILSHEIRNPLGGITSVTELLEMTGLSTEQQAYIDIIKKSSHTLMDLLDNVLELSKLEAGKITIENELFDLPTLVEEASYLFAAKALENNIEMIMDIEEDIPLLYGDTRKIRQILINLISNAIKFTSNGDVHIQASILALSGEDARDVSLQIQVTDTGIGMDEQHVNRMFEPYYRGEKKNTRFKGTGLGLVVCKQLVELMDGEITVSSLEGKGSIFSFSIPLTRHELSTPSLRQPTLLNKNILLIDDNAKVLQWVTRLADAWGIHMLKTSDMNEAMHWMDQGMIFDAVLVDYELMMLQPETIQRRLRELQKSEKTAVIVLASLGTAMNHEVDTWSKNVVIKPMRRMYLLNALIFALTDQADHTDSAPDLRPLL